MKSSRIRSLICVHIVADIILFHQFHRAFFNFHLGNNIAEAFDDGITTFSWGVPRFKRAER